MPDCGGTSCSCSVKVGPGLTVSGSGSADNPFVIGLAGTIEDSLIIEDSPTIDLILNGGGSPTDPYRLKAQSKIKVTDLKDVLDPEGAPSAGDTLIWVTADVAEPRFEFRPPPPNPAGAVNIGAGLAGDGSVGAPLRPNLVTATPTGPTTGLEVYIDTAGNLRAEQPVATAVTWGSIGGKPTVFPTDPANFSGVLPATKGGTGQSDLAAVTVGNATKVGGIKIWVQSGTPVGATANDLWFWG